MGTSCYPSCSEGIRRHALYRQIPQRASRVRADAITEAIPIDEDALYTTRPRTSIVRRHNAGVAYAPTRVKEEPQSGTTIASFGFVLTVAGLVLMSLFFAIGYSNPKWWMHKGPLFAVAQQI